MAVPVEVGSLPLPMPTGLSPLADDEETDRPKRLLADVVADVGGSLAWNDEGLDDPRRTGEEEGLAVPKRTGGLVAPATCELDVVKVPKWFLIWAGDWTALVAVDADRPVGLVVVPIIEALP